VRAKNTAEILTKNVGLYSIACVMYMLCSATGSCTATALRRAFRRSACSAPTTTRRPTVRRGRRRHAPYYSKLSDFFFQVVFVATAMSIVSGAVAERMKLWSFFAFAVVFTGFVYPVQGYWKWGGGWLDEAGFLDFAGSGVVHMAGAARRSPACCCSARARASTGRKGEVRPIPGANLPLATLGTFILWFGWFGFNGGSELKVSTSARPTRWRGCSSTPTWPPPAAWSRRCCWRAVVRQGRPDDGAERRARRAGRDHRRTADADAAARRPDRRDRRLIVVVRSSAWTSCASTIRSARSRCTAWCGIWGLLAVCLSNDDASLSRS
jgi:hypothetical protein